MTNDEFPEGIMGSSWVWGRKPFVNWYISTFPSRFVVLTGAANAYLSVLSLRPISLLLLRLVHNTQCHCR